MEYFSSKSSNLPPPFFHSCQGLPPSPGPRGGAEEAKEPRASLEYIAISLASLHLEAYNFTGQSSFFCLPSKPKAREHKSPFRIFLGLPLKVIGAPVVSLVRVTGLPISPSQFSRHCIASQQLDKPTRKGGYLTSKKQLNLLASLNHAKVRVRR